MPVIYFLCAVVGGTLLVCQFLMGLLGLGGHHDLADHGGGDVDHDVSHGHGHGTDHESVGHESAMTWLVGVLTFRTIVAALTFFGLAGLAANEALEGSAIPYSQLIILVIALGVGLASMFGVATIMRSLHRLKHDGTVRIERSVGHHGTVYLRVPGQRKGTGKVTLNLQNRSVEYLAVTSQEELPTGSKIVVVGVISPDTVEVAPAAGSPGTADKDTQRVSQS